MIKLNNVRNFLNLNFLLNYRLLSSVTNESNISEKKYLTACCVSDEINIKTIKSFLKNVDNVKELSLPAEIQRLTYCGQYKTKIDRKTFFIFHGGVISFWDMNIDERSEIINMTKPFQVNSIYDYMNEEDFLPYFYHNDKTKVNKDAIYLKIPHSQEQEYKLIEQQMAMSEALSQSVKLGIYESQFEVFSTSINIWIDKMKSGRNFFNKIKEWEVLKKTGELFTMRHKINVSSHITEVPDIYWQKNDLEYLFDQIRRDLSMSSRIRILNEKLNLYSELTEVLRNHIAFMHSTKLEIMIIILILIEVIFECFSFYEKYSVNSELNFEKT